MSALLLSFLHVDAQGPNQGIRPNIPPTPQAVAFNRLGDYQVNNNYGMPDISIPLYEIDFYGYKIPLTLHYEANPIKPGYNYDVTGLGWTLSGNSCVSRTIKDVADECANKPFTLDNFRLSSGENKEFLYYKEHNMLEQLNFQFDSYNIVLPTGRTIPFFMYKTDDVMEYHLMPLDENVKIFCDYKINTIDAFTVIDESGIIYHFTLSEKATNIFQNDINADRKVTWLLTSIDIPSKGTIYYQYIEKPVIIHAHNILREPTITVSRLFEGWEVNFDKSFNVKGYFQSQSPRYDMMFLKRIIYGPTTIDYNYADDKQHMKEIVISDNGKTIRKIALNVYGYTSVPNWQLQSVVISGQDDKGKEDKLEYGLTYYGINPGNYTDYWGNRCNPGPSLNDENGISRNNHGMDDLGNFNMYFGYEGVGLSWTDIQYRLSHNGILAQLIENNEGDHSYYYKLKLQSTTEGDTRIPTSPNKHGVLKSITYPNGGGATFIWENHRFLTATAANGDIIYDRRNQRIINGGGFRIASISNWTTDGASTTDYYRYGFTFGDILHRNFPLPLPDFIKSGNFVINDTINNHIGCGEAVVDPNLFTFMSGFSYSTTPQEGYNSTYSGIYSYAPPAEFRNMLIGKYSRFKDITNIQGIYTWWDATFSATNFRSLIGGRQPVVYPEITVYHGDPTLKNDCKSKTVYKYDIYKYQFPNDTLSSNYLSSFSQIANPDTAYFEPVYFSELYPALSCVEYPAERNQLKRKSDYSLNTMTGKWDLVSEENYSYKKEQLSKSGFILDSNISKENYAPNYGGYSSNQERPPHPLDNIPLRDFYKQNMQYLGRFTMNKKITSIMRPGGMQTVYNSLTESYNYKYPGVLESKKYSDQLKNKYSFTYEKEDSIIYVGNNREESDVLTEMKSRNMLTSMLSSELYSMESDEPSTLLSGNKIDYAFYGDDILPSKLYESNGEKYEESLTVLSYDDYGNPTEIVDLKTGIHSVYLWDKDGRYMLAMINNTTLSQIGNTIDFLSANSQSRHSMLQSKFPQAQIQTWDYKPLIGVSSFTDINGVTILYEYDGLGRLISEKKVVNGIAEPEVLHKYEYNYKNK